MSYFQQEGIFDVQTGHTEWVDMFHGLRANPLTRLAGTTFVGNTKDTHFWTDTTTGTGSNTQTAGTIVLSTGTGSNGTAQYQTVRVARWVPGQENTFRTVLRVGDIGATNNKRNWGMFDSTNGLFFQLDNTNLNLVTRSGSVDTTVTKGNWSVSNSFTMDTTYHVWEIQTAYQDTHWFIDGVFIHEITPATSFPYQSLNLPVTLQDNNSGGSTTKCDMTVGVAFITRTGQLGTEVTSFNNTTNVTTVLKYGAGRLARVTINNGGNSSNQLAIFDNTSGSGTTIATINTGASVLPVTIDYGLPFHVGLTIVSSGGTTIANTTIIYE